MNMNRFIHYLRRTAASIISTVCLAAGLGLGTVQAVTTTKVISLGTSGNGSSFGRDSQPNLKRMFSLGELGLPVGSILRSVTFNYRLDAGDPYLGDLALILADNDCNNGVLMIAGQPNDEGYTKSATPKLSWNSGGDYSIGATAIGTVTTGHLNLDLRNYAVWLHTGYPGKWSGSVTLVYDVTELAVVLTSPTNGEEFPSGTYVNASANALEPGAFTDTVTFHVTPISPPGPKVQFASAEVSSPFEANLGLLAEGTYEIYATVINDNVTPNTATSATRTFTIAAGVATTTTVTSSANPSTYGSCSLTATVSPVPTGGTVRFYRDGSPLGSPVAVNAITGQAIYNANTLGVNTHEITADFSGFGIYSDSASSALEQTVNQAVLTVKALNSLRAPNTENPSPFPTQFSGFQNGQNLGSSGVSGTPEITTTAVLASPLGNYPITVALGTLASANYSFTFENATLTVANMTDTFSINFYAFPGWMTAAQQAHLLMPAPVPAGLGSWFTSGWRNVEVPWGGGLQPIVALTSNLGSSANFIFKDCRNGWASWGEPRTSNLGEGNYNMMAAGVNATLHVDAPAVPGDNNFVMEMNNIPFATYDVIFYFRANDAQFGDGTGVIKFNGGANRAYKLKSGAFDGNFIEMADATTEGNYILFTGVTGSSFVAETWGTGDNGFNHNGPAGIQVRQSVAVSGFASWQGGNSATGQSLDQDHDNDGVTNGIEYFLVGPSGNSSGFTSLPTAVDEGGGILSITWPKGAGYTGAYDTDFVVETSTTLSGTWTAQPLANVVVTPSSVKYIFPGGPAYTGKNFARLRVKGP